MAKEIERRYRVTDDSWREHIVRSINMEQGYLATGNATVRIRIAAEEAWITVKGPSDKSRLMCDEFEYAIPYLEAREMLDKLSVGYRIQKTRHIVDINGVEFEIDEFFAENRELVIAELELSNPAAKPIPPAFGYEITADWRYANSALSIRPFAHWSNRDKRPPKEPHHDA